MDAMEEYTFAFLSGKPKLTRLIALMAQSTAMSEDLLDDENVKTKFIGDWDSVSPGDKVVITFVDPYRVEEGFLFTLPDMGGSFQEAALVQVPNTEADQELTRWFTLPHLACISETIELEKTL